MPTSTGWLSEKGSKLLKYIRGNVISSKDTNQDDLEGIREKIVNRGVTSTHTQHQCNVTGTESTRDHQHTPTHALNSPIPTITQPNPTPHPAEGIGGIQVMMGSSGYDESRNGPKGHTTVKLNKYVAAIQGLAHRLLNPIPQLIPQTTGGSTWDRRGRGSWGRIYEENATKLIGNNVESGTTTRSQAIRQGQHT